MEDGYSWEGTRSGGSATFTGFTIIKYIYFLKENTITSMYFKFRDSRSNSYHIAISLSFRLIMLLSSSIIYIAKKVIVPFR
jgi:hypothetical protein